MLRKLMFVFSIAAYFAGRGLNGPAANAQEVGNVQVVSFGQNTVYTVIYWNVRFPDRWHVYGTYTDWATAVRVASFVNSFPEYRAAIR